MKLKDHLSLDLQVTLRVTSCGTGWGRHYVLPLKQGVWGEGGAGLREGVSSFPSPHLLPSSVWWQLFYHAWAWPPAPCQGRATQTQAVPFLSPGSGPGSRPA